MFNYEPKCKKLSIFVLILCVFCLSASSIKAENNPYFTPIRWSADSKRIAIAINDIVEVHDVSTNQTLYTLKHHKDTITAVAWSPDNKVVATASYDQTINLWNVSDGSFIRTLSGQNDIVAAIVWSLDSKLLISSGFDTQPNLAVWDIASGQILSRHTSGTIVDASFSPDGSTFAYVTPLSLQTLNAVSFNVIATSQQVPCCTNVLTSIAWSSDSSKVVTGSKNGLVTIWDAKTAGQIDQFTVNTYSKPNAQDIPDLGLSWVRDARFSLDGNSVISVSGDGTLNEWDIATKKIIRNQQIAPLAVAAFSPYTGRLAYLDATMLSTVDNPSFQSLNMPSSFNVIIPLVSSEKLQIITKACALQSDVRQSLTAQINANKLADFSTQVSALTDAQIPPGCKADLLAVAGALMGKS